MKFVASVTGLNEHTIRAWEKRYQIVTPIRSEIGRRLYNDQDIEKLNLIKNILDKTSFKISDLVNKNSSELQGVYDSSFKKQTLKNSSKQFEFSLSILELAIATKNIKVILNELESKLTLGLSQEVDYQYLLKDFYIPAYSLLLNYGQTGKIEIEFEELILKFIKNHIKRLYYLIKLDFNPKNQCNLPLLIGSTGSTRGEIDSLICCSLSYLNNTPAIFIGNRLNVEVINHFASSVAHKAIMITDRYVTFKTRPNLFEQIGRMNFASFKSNLMTLVHNYKNPKQVDFLPQIGQQFQNFDSFSQYMQYSA
jgi:DNA-binding transcriptional MerR regulator